MVECKNCGSLELQKNGTRILSDGKYQAYRCKKCGHQFTGEQLTIFEAKLRISEQE